MKRDRCHHCKRRITPGETLISVREYIATKHGRTRLSTKVYCSNHCVADAHE